MRPARGMDHELSTPREAGNVGVVTIDTSTDQSGRQRAFFRSRESARRGREHPTYSASGAGRGRSLRLRRRREDHIRGGRCEEGARQMLGRGIPIATRHGRPPTCRSFAPSRGFVWRRRVEIAPRYATRIIAATTMRSLRRSNSISAPPPTWAAPICWPSAVSLRAPGRSAFTGDSTTPRRLERWNIVNKVVPGIAAHRGDGVGAKVRERANQGSRRHQAAAVRAFSIMAACAADELLIDLGTLHCSIRRTSEALAQQAVVDARFEELPWGGEGHLSRYLTIRHTWCVTSLPRSRRK